MSSTAHLDLLEGALVFGNSGYIIALFAQKLVQQGQKLRMIVDHCQPLFVCHCVPPVQAAKFEECIIGVSFQCVETKGERDRIANLAQALRPSSILNLLSSLCLCAEVVSAYLKSPISKLLPAAAAAATSVFVGSTMVATRFVIDQTGPASLALLRYGIGFCCLLPLVLLSPRARFERRDLLPIALLGIAQFGILVALLTMLLAALNL
jgi:hypothetical protein